MPGDPPDSRSHLLIDRFTHVLERISARRRGALEEAGSVESLTWNLFRSLGQIHPALWLPRLLRRALGRAPRFTRRELDSLRISLWEEVGPPPSRQEALRRRALAGTLVPAAGRLRRGRVTPLSVLRRRWAEAARAGQELEPPLEVGAVLRTRRRVIYVLPVLESELEMEVACDRRRDALLRALDAGWYETDSGRRRPLSFCLVLLYRDEAATPRSIRLLRRYREQPQALARGLAHRRDFDSRLAAAGLGMLRWRDLCRRLEWLIQRGVLDPFEAAIAQRLLEHLRAEGLARGRRPGGTP